MFRDAVSDELERRGESVRAFAARVGVHRGNLNDWLTSKRSIRDDTLEVIMEALGLRITRHAARSRGARGVAKKSARTSR